MRAFIKRYPENAKTEFEAEVYLETGWHDWIINDPNGRYGGMLDENYHYAMCEDLPDECAPTAIPTDFDVTEHTTEVPSEDPEGQPTTIKSWTAIFVKERWEQRPKEEYQ